MNIWIRFLICIQISLCTGIAVYFFNENIIDALIISIVMISAMLSLLPERAEDVSDTQRVILNPELLQLRKKQVIEDISLMETTLELQRTVFEAATDLVGCINTSDARQRFARTLRTYWQFKSADLFIWEKGEWKSIGGEATGSEPILLGPVQLTDKDNRDVVLDLSPAVTGQAAIVLRQAKAQPTIRTQSEIDQRYIAEILRGQLALSLRRVILYERLQELGRTDPLTGTHRRWYGMKRLEELANDDCTLSIAMIDIDHFKGINDDFGHSVGDQVLHIVGHTLVQALRPTDFVIRYGGEEFLILLPHTHQNQAWLVVDRLRLMIEGLRNLPVRVTVSCGVTNCLIDDTAESLIERADRSLYEAKNAGRNQVIQTAHSEDNVRHTQIFKRADRKKDR